jgi:hypothetical protein
MKNDCTKWKNELLEAALAGIVAGGLEEHMSKCADCTAEFAALSAKREQMDALLPLVAQGAEPPPEFRTRVLAAAGTASEPMRGRPWQVWGLCGAMAAIVAMLVVGFTLQRRRIVPHGELAAAERLAEWRAPSDVLLETPGREILWKTPRLGESYLHIPVTKDREE